MTTLSRREMVRMSFGAVPAMIPLAVAKATIPYLMRRAMTTFMAVANQT